MVVFPLGMYSVAGLPLGTAAGLALIRRAGVVAAWPAAAAWALTFALMAAAPLTRRSPARPPARQVPGSRTRRRPRAPSPRSARTDAPRKRYKYQARLTLLPPAGTGPGASLTGPAFRAVVRARHHQTRCGQVFSALVTTHDHGPLAPDSATIVTVAVLGYDADDYLAAGDSFTLWHGRDIARGVVTRRIFT
jgi:hypothetical protein